MAHRRTQILNALRTIIQAAASSTGVPSQNVFKNRALSLAEDHAEMPAICINRGEDQPTSEFGNDNLSSIDGLLTVTIVGYFVGDTEDEVVEALDEQARYVQSAILADQSLGLSFVIGSRYGGSDEPQLDSTGERIVGSLESPWQVHYRQRIPDPGD
jgi:hypothetical protein